MSDADTAVVAVNYIDIKLHDVHNIPPSWWAEGKPPAFPEHPFRYEVTFSIDGQTTHSFRHGRLLQALPQYENYIAGATPPPLPSSMNEMLRHIRELPETPTVGSATSSKLTAASTRKTTGDGAEEVNNNNNEEEVKKTPTVETKILWVITPASDALAPAAEEGQGTKRRKRILTTASATEETPPPPIPTEDDAPPCVMRVPLGEQHVAALESMMLSGKPLELNFTRVLKAGVPHEWEDTQEWYFRAVIPVDLSPFSEPGSLQLAETVPLMPVKGLINTEEKGRKKVTKRPKSGTPGILYEDIDTEAEHPYVLNSTSATISVQLEKTLTRLATDRVRPPLTPRNLIPARAPPKGEYKDCTRQFTDVVKSIAEKIMQDYTEAEIKGNFKNQAELLGSFQTTGQLAAYKDQLTPLVVKLAREKFLRDPNVSPDVINQITNELYVYLLDCVHATLRSMTEGEVVEKGINKSNGNGNTILLENTEQSSGGITSLMWFERAKEAETLREYGQAAKYHQARIANCSSSEDFPKVWNDAASFFVRIGDAAKAEQCYREAIAHNPIYVDSLIGFGDLLLAYNRFDEAAVFLHAAVDAEPSALSWGHISLLCDLHVLALTQGPQYESKRAYWEREGALAMKEAMATTEEVDFNEVSLAVADYLLQLRHTDLANVCLSRCRSGGKTEVLCARLFLLCGQYENALSSLDNKESLKPFADEIGIICGDCYVAMGRSEEAIHAYKSVLCRDNKTPKPLYGPSYIHLGNLLILAGRYKDAIGVFTIGIQAWPCSLMWLGTGIAYYRMRELDAAEECLSESNTLNNTNPRTWAYLTLICLQKERVEVEMVLQQTLMQGLTDATLLTELGRDLIRAARIKLGENCLRKAITVEQEGGRASSATCCTAMYYLAGAIKNTHWHEAKEMYGEVVKLSKNEVLRAKAEEQLLQFSK